MEHLCLPKDPSSTPARVPCVCNRATPYDGGDFATFPERDGWPDDLPINQAVPFYVSSEDDVIHEPRIRQQEKLLQSWLFFGQLHALLSPFDLYDAEDYIVEDDGDADDKLWLNTECLEHKLPQWHQAVLSLDNDTKRTFIENAKARYSIAAEKMLILSSGNLLSFDPMIKMSLQAICSVVEGVIVHAVDRAVHSLTPQLNIRLTASIMEAMLDNGWCPFDVSVVDKLGGLSPSIVWYVQHMRKPEPRALHAGCTQDACQRTQIDLMSYRTRHVTADCACISLGPEAADIMACLSQGTIPVLELVGGISGAVDIIVHNSKNLAQDQGYAAISHVWADGLGNPLENRLPQCQLQRLQHLVNRIEISGDSSDSSPQKTKLYLWCDTLCCPVENEGKQKALALMREVYTNASVVLVLDQELAPYSYEEIGTLEAGWRIIMSRYMRRLWTYQEAGLAKKLLFQFADAAVDARPIQRAAARRYTTSLTSDHLNLHIVAVLANIRTWLGKDPDEAWIRNAITGISQRSVSVSTDEPLCLATVLGLDITPIAQAIPEQRMACFWQLVARDERGLSLNVIFNSLRRLDHPGLRWAPASILQPVSRLREVVIQDTPDDTSILLKHGLRIRCAGWRIRRAELPGHLTDAFWPVANGMGALVQGRAGDGTYYNIMTAPVQEVTRSESSLLDLLADRTREWYVILHRGQYAWAWARWFSQRKAILATKERNEYGLTYFQTHMLVFVDRVEPRSELGYQIDYIWASKIRRSWAIMALNVLDGTENIVVAIMPTLITSAFRRVFAASFNWAGSTIGTRLRKMMAQTRAKAPQTSAVKKHLRNTPSELDLSKVGTTIIQAVMGRYVHFEETFDATTEWVVD